MLARLGGWTQPSMPPTAVRPSDRQRTDPPSETLTGGLSQATIMLGRRGDSADSIRTTSRSPWRPACSVCGSASRLRARVRDEGLAYSVYSYVSPARYAATFVVAAQTRTRRGAEGQRPLEEELTRMVRQPGQRRRAAPGQGLPDRQLSAPPGHHRQGRRLHRRDRRAGAGPGLRRPLHGQRRAGDRRRRAAGAGRFMAPDAFNRVVVGGKP